MNMILKSSLKTIFINVLVLFVILNVLYWSIPTVDVITRVSKFTRGVITQWTKSSEIERSKKIDILDEFPWAAQYRREFKQLSTSYQSYVGWRHEPFSGSTINVIGPYHQRRTLNQGTHGEIKAYFFGGSTIWGIGSNDGGTIPSLFAAMTGIHTENFGETAYTAHQNVVTLIQLLQEGHRPDLVVFYDGGNEIYVKCRRELTPMSHSKEQQFRSILSIGTAPNTFRYFMNPVVRVAEKLNNRIFPDKREEYHDCHTNARKAEAIAENLIKDWEIAKLLVESHGGKFVGILQPVSYFAKTPLDHLKGTPILAPEYKVVYPLIRKKIAVGTQYYDLTSVLDTDMRVYLDFDHVTPKGNRIITQKIVEIVGPLGFGPRSKADFSPDN